MQWPVPWPAFTHMRTRIHPNRHALTCLHERMCTHFYSHMHKRTQTLSHTPFLTSTHTHEKKIRTCAGASAGSQGGRGGSSARKGRGRHGRPAGGAAAALAARKPGQAAINARHGRPAIAAHPQQDAVTLWQQQGHATANSSSRGSGGPGYGYGCRRGGGGGGQGWGGGTSGGGACSSG